MLHMQSTAAEQPRSEGRRSEVDETYWTYLTPPHHNRDNPFHALNCGQFYLLTTAESEMKLRAEPCFFLMIRHL